MITIMPTFECRATYDAVMDDTYCVVEGCSKRRQAHKKCKKHVEADDGLPRCTFIDCDRAERARGLCFGHYDQSRSGRPLAPIKKWSNENCVGPLCDRMASGRDGYCRRHHEQWRTHGEVWAIGTRRQPGRSPVVECVEVGCTSREIVTLSRCMTHALTAHGECWLPWCHKPGHEHIGMCEEHRSRERSMKHSYGFGWKRRLEMSVDQGGRCAICGEQEDLTTPNRGLHIDHDHDTGIVRGLLCGLCNRGIGALRHDTSRLARAIDYLKKTDRRG